VQALNLPPFPFKIQEDSGLLKIFDPLRRKYLVLTPEEWVRQHFVQFLISEKGFPKSLFLLENVVFHHQRKGRFDVMCVDRNGKPILLVECKAPYVKMTQGTFDQIGRYNSKLKVPYLAVTNGLQHYFMQVDFEKSAIKFIEELPHYEYLVP
jgi:hypothetical protein